MSRMIHCDCGCSFTVGRRDKPICFNCKRSHPSPYGKNEPITEYELCLYGDDQEEMLDLMKFIEGDR